MFRKYILASAVSLALLPGAAGALALGSIRAQSALNEPFAGQIELLDVAPDQVGTVKALLASEDEFNKVGAPRPGFLSGLSFTPVVSSRGSPIIQITSTEPVREPYLDFLIEVNSPAGRVVKEYTVLLDPPVTLDSPPPEVEQAAIERPTPKNYARSESPPRQEQASTDPLAFPMRYGPVRSGEGLWKIARKMAKTSGASVAQTAMALYRSNQRAFIRGDIDRLKLGMELEIPSSAELMALDAGQAEREFRAALRGEDVASAPLAKITAAPGPDDRLKIAGTPEPASSEPPGLDAPPEETSTESTGQAGAVPETAVGSEGAASDEEAPDLGVIKQDLLLVQEAGESTRQETVELRGRIRELETQLVDIQRLLNLSNERFAQLQASGAQTSEGLGLDGTDEAPTGDAVEPAAAPGQVDDRKADAAPAPIEAPPAAPRSDTGAGEPAPEDVSPYGFWGWISQPMLAVAIPLLFLLLGGMIYKRRKTLEETSTPGELAAEIPKVETAVAAKADGSTEQSAESVDVTVATQLPYSGFGNFEDETEEADVISEADVYIAYGRYREAEALLEEEVGKAPDRLDVKYKLTEAQYGAGNVAGMEATMSQMQQAGVDQSDPDQWRRLDAMLRDLKGESADGTDAVTAAAATPTVVGHGLVQPPEGTSPRSSDPDSMKHSFSGGEDVLSATPVTAGVQDRHSQDLDLELEDLDVVGAGLQIPASEERPEMSATAGAASDLELQLEDLESLRGLDLASFTNQMSPAEQRPAGIESPPSADAGEDSLDIAPVSKEGHASDVLSSQWQMDSGVWDEVSTKIDLARAYMEMEDSEAARVILEEVAQEGTEDQRAEAREMMEQLG